MRKIDKDNNLESLYKRFIKSMKIRNLSERSIENMKWRLSKFFDYLTQEEITSIDQISKDIIREYQVEVYQTLNKKGLPNSAAHQNNMLSAVKEFFKFLIESDYIMYDPTQTVRYAKLPSRLPSNVLKASEARKILHAPDTKSVIGYRDRVVLEVLYSTGIRKTEIINLILSDIDYKDGFVSVIAGKGKKDRVVPMGKIACRYVENYIKSVRPELIKDPYNQHLFLSLKGRRLASTTLSDIIKKYTKLAKIKKKVSPHTFRHSCATSMLKNKANIRVIQKLLGHASLNTTQIYTHLSINDLKQVHKACHPREQDKE